MSCRLSVALPAVASLALVALPLSSAERRDDKAPDAADARPVIRPVTKPRLTLRLYGGRSLLAREEWALLSTTLQRLFDEDDDAFVPVPGRTWPSLSVETERLFGALPRPGREAYRQAHNAGAAALLGAAKTPSEFAVVVRRYLHTDSGPDALLGLATRSLDEGDVYRAAAAFAQLQQHRGLARWAPEELFRAAKALRRAGDRAAAQPVEAELLGRIGPAGLRLDKEIYTPERLRKELEDFAPPPREGRLLFGGDAARSGEDAATAPFLQRRFTQPMFRSARGPGAAKINQAINALKKNGQPVLAPFQPLVLMASYRVRATGGMAKRPLAIFRTFWGIVAVEMEKGKIAWESASPSSLDAMAGSAGRLGSPNRTRALEHWTQFYLSFVQKPAMLFENSTIGRLSSDGELVFAVEDFQVPPMPEIPAGNQIGVKDEVLKKALHHNTLIALSAGSGALKWELGGPRDKLGLGGTFFLGPPLPLGGKLYVINQKGRELRLVTIEPYKKKDDATGREFDAIRLGGVQRLAVLPDRIEESPVRRANACEPAYGDGVLVCPSNAGAVFGVDLATGGLLWSHVYREKGDEIEWKAGDGSKPLPLDWVRLPDGTTRPLLTGPKATWKTTAPVVHDGKVVVAAPDARSLFCLDLKTGARLWSRARAEDDLYLGGVFGDRVLVVGKTFCRALNLHSGATLWVARTGEPTGFGAGGAGTYYVPVRKGADGKESEIIAVDLATGRVRARTTGRDFPGGNLVYYGDQLLVQSLTDLTGYPLLRARLAVIDKEVEAKPDDLPLRFERATLRYEAGDLPGAIADLKKILAAKPERELLRRARAMLLDLYAELLRDAFAANEGLVEEYAKLIPLGADPAPWPLRWARDAESRRRQAELLALRGLGCENEGRLGEALTHYLALAGAAAADELFEAPGDAGLQWSRSLWLRGRVEGVLKRATPGQRRAFEEQIRERLRSLRDRGDRGAVRTLTGAGGEEAVLERADRLFKDKEYLQSDLLLLGLRRRTADKARLGRALLLLARSCVERRLYDEGAFYYRQLGRECAAIQVSGDKTGADLLREARDDRRLRDALADRPSRPMSPAKQEEGTFPPADLLPLETNGDEVLPFFRRHRVGPLLLSRELCLEDGLSDKRLWRVEVPADAHAALGESLRKGDAPPAVAVGHLLLVRAGDWLLAIDAAGGRLLWKTATPSAPVGMAVQPSAVCVLTRDGLEALEPFSGRPLWRRQGLSPGGRLTADERHLYAVEADAEGRPFAGHVFRLDDGTEVGTHDFSGRPHRRWRLIGGRLVWEEGGGDAGVTLGGDDLRSGKAVWEKTYPTGSRLLDSLDPSLAGVLEKTGRLSILDAGTGRLLANLDVDREGIDQLKVAYLLADADRFYVSLVRPEEPDLVVPPGVVPNIDPGVPPRVVPVNGPLVAIDRKSGGRRWDLEPSNTTLLLDRFGEMPVLVLTGKYTVADKRMGFTGSRSNAKVYDKGTGKILFTDRLTGANLTPFPPLRAVRFDPASGQVRIQAAEKELVFTPKDK